MQLFTVWVSYTWNVTETALHEWCFWVANSQGIPSNKHFEKILRFQNLTVFIAKIYIVKNYQTGQCHNNLVIPKTEEQNGEQQSSEQLLQLKLHHSWQALSSKILCIMHVLHAQSILGEMWDKHQDSLFCWWQSDMHWNYYEKCKD